MNKLKNDYDKSKSELDDPKKEIVKRRTKDGVRD